MSEIYDLTFSFNLVRNYIIFSFKRFYGEFVVLGKENIPTDSPLIFAPNHTNALMDALAVHSIAPSGFSVIFLARADIFKNKSAAKLLRFAKIMPAFRMRDGMENLGKNNEVFEQCVDVLSYNKALGIMPEGNQEIERKLRPLVKGIFRIAFAAQQKRGTQSSVKIIPVGIDYGDIVKSNKHIIINVGKPIDVAEYMVAYAENSVLATNEIRDKLRDELSDLSLNLATDKYYECFEIAIKVANQSMLEELNLPETTVNRSVARQKIAERLVLLERNEPEKIEVLNNLCIEYEDLLKTINLKSWVLDHKSAKFPISREGLWLFLTLPVFIYGFSVNYLPFFMPVFIRKYVMKAQFIGFFSSLQFVLGIITFPLFYILQTLLFGLLISNSWWIIILFFCTQYPFGKWALRWNRKMKKFWAKIRYNRLNQKGSFDLRNAQRIHRQIINLME